MTRKCIYIIKKSNAYEDRCVLDTIQKLQEVVESVLLVIKEKTGDCFFQQRVDDAVLIYPDVKYDEINYYDLFIKIGWSELIRWDEVIVIDDTLIGPVCSLRNMLIQMEARKELDFWGLSVCNYALAKSKKAEQGDKNAQWYIPFRFISFRNNLLRASIFQDELRKLYHTEEKNPSREVNFEYSLMQSLTGKGYQWDSYIKTPDDRQDVFDFLFIDPLRAVRDEHCPFFLRNMFTCPQMEYITGSAGEQPWELYRYLERKTDYDVNMILEALIRREYQDDIARTLRLTYVLPSESSKAHEEKDPRESRLRIALVMHLYYMDLLKESFHYASSMPEDTDFYIFTNSPKNEKIIWDCFQRLRNPLTVRVTQNRGRDVGSMLIESRELQERYDLICFYHDKKSNHISPHTAGSSFAYTTAECALSSKTYVRNVIALFEKKPYLGMLSGPTATHGDFLSMIGAEWGVNYTRTKELAEELKIRAPMSEDHIPAIGLGDVFWYRTKAMAPMFRKNWTYEDFPEEPVGMDGTILHAIERLYPFAVQEAGYLPGRVMPDHMAALELSNLEFYVREYNKVLKDAEISGDIRTTTTLLKERTSRAFLELARSANFPDQLRLIMERHLPGWLYRAIYRKK